MNGTPSHIVVDQLVVDQLVNQDLLTPLAQAGINCQKLRISDWQKTTLSVQDRAASVDICPSFDPML